MSEDLVRRVYDTSYRRLVGQLYGVCGDLSDAEDVVQEAFARAVAQPRRFAKVDNPEAWLRTVAVNLARTRHRRRLLGDRLLSRASAQAAHPADLTEDRVALVEAMRRLPAAQREALALHYLGDLPVHEVARTVDAPLGTVKARLSRGRAALAALLAEPTAPAPDSAQEVRRA